MRKPNFKIGVKGCRDCPMVTQHVDDWGREEDSFSCQHPDAEGRSILDSSVYNSRDNLPETPADFCPLVRTNITITLIENEADSVQ